MNPAQVAARIEAHIASLHSEGMAYAAQAVRLSLEAFLAQNEVAGADGARLVTTPLAASLDAVWRPAAGNMAFAGPMIGEEVRALGRLLVAPGDGAAWARSRRERTCGPRSTR